jgi:hypothetical protein
VYQNLKAITCTVSSMLVAMVIAGILFSTPILDCHMMHCDESPLEVPILLILFTTMVFIPVRIFMKKILRLS